jgi:hypothetical protein
MKYVYGMRKLPQKGSKHVEYTLLLFFFFHTLTLNYLALDNHCSYSKDLRKILDFSNFISDETLCWTTMTPERIKLSDCTFHRSKENNFFYRMDIFKFKTKRKKRSESCSQNVQRALIRLVNY